MLRVADLWLTRVIIIAGIMIPWCIGIGVKIYLDLQGEPTWSWLYFFQPGILLAEIWAMFWFAAPSLLLGLLAYLLFSGRIRRLSFLNHFEQWLVVVPSAIWGGLGSVPIFLEVFWELDPIVFYVPFFITAVYVGDYVVGLIAGFAMALASYGIRKTIHEK